jgi:hypothetical protein
MNHRGISLRMNAGWLGVVAPAKTPAAIRQCRCGKACSRRPGSS